MQPPAQVCSSAQGRELSLCFWPCSVDECGNTCVTGKVGRGYLCRRVTKLRDWPNGMLVFAPTAVGSLDSIRGIVKVAGFVNSVEGLEQQPQVVNGASDLLVEIFGDQGRHARSAIGVASLPGNIPVEIEMIAEVCCIVRTRGLYHMRFQFISHRNPMFVCMHATRLLVVQDTGSV